VGAKEPDRHPAFVASFPARQNKSIPLARIKDEYPLVSRASRDDLDIIDAQHIVSFSREGANEDPSDLYIRATSALDFGRDRSNGFQSQLNRKGAILRIPADV
jgi:hypothetical protein